MKKWINQTTLFNTIPKFSNDLHNLSFLELCNRCNLDVLKLHEGKYLMRDVLTDEFFMYLNAFFINEC